MAKKIFMATVTVIKKDRVYVQANNQKDAQRFLSDNTTTKRVKNMSYDISYGDMRETDKMPRLSKKKITAKAKKAVKK